MEDLFDCPSQETWNSRNEWIDKEIQDSEPLSYMVSDHSTALFMDMRKAYCAGAWLSVIVMSVSVIDSHLRETEAMDNKIGTQKLFNDFFTGEDINWLRLLRNKYVHVNIDKPVLEMNDWFNNQKEMEADATKAIRLTIHAFFQNPGT